MSRKKVKKETVKRKTNIYDPMSVYGRGLTENQRLGMTTQMKIENMAIPKPVITREVLEEYQKILTYYGMHTIVPYGNIRCIPISFQFKELFQIDNSKIMTALSNIGIQPQFFECDTFVISKPVETGMWSTSLWYEIFLGNSSMYIHNSIKNVAISTGDDSVTVPRYFKLGNDLYYFKLYFDLDVSDTFIDQEIYEFTESEHHEDFDVLPNDGSPIPYLLYPNTAFPEMYFRIGMGLPGTAEYTVTAYITVMY